MYTTLFNQVERNLSGILAVVNTVLLALENLSEQIDTAHAFEGWREKYTLADDSTKLEALPRRTIQSPCVAIVFSSIAINPLSNIPPEAFINISSLCLI